MKHLKISVFGKVQGVFFRACTKTEADSLGLKGWCENRADGSVYIEVEGLPEQIEKFRAWCHKGSDFSQVDKVVAEEGALKEFEAFKIKRS